jgi:ABC-type Na+ transport system ATPase subunit NatA
MMRGFTDRGRTILFSTHYLEEADSAADRIILMAGGASSPTAPRRPSRIPWVCG